MFVCCIKRLCYKGLFFIILFFMIYDVVLVAVFWLLFGSFGGVILMRGQDISWASIKSIVWWRSQCDTTKKPLMWYELIPLLSFFLTKKSISVWYIWREVVSSFIFVWVFFSLWQVFSLAFFLRVFFWRSLWLLALWDIRTYTLHMMMYYISCISAFFLLLFLWEGDMLLWMFVTCLLVLWLYYFARWYISLRLWEKRDGLWVWDIYVAPLLWCALSVIPIIWITNTFQILLFWLLWASCIGLFFWLIRFFMVTTTKKRHWRDESQIVPFLPCLIVSAFLLWIYGEQIFLLFHY